MHNYLKYEKSRIKVRSFLKLVFACLVMFLFIYLFIYFAERFLLILFVVFFFKTFALKFSVVFCQYGFWPVDPVVLSCTLSQKGILGLVVQFSLLWLECKMFTVFGVRHGVRSMNSRNMNHACASVKKAQNCNKDCIISGISLDTKQTFCLTVRAYLNTQKYGLFCSLAFNNL